MEQIGVLFFSISWGMLLWLISIAILLPFIVYSLIKKKFKLLFISSAIILFLFVSTCCLSELILINGVYSGPPTPILEPRSDDVIGTWYMSESTVSFLNYEGYTAKSHELVFQEDGTFRAVNVPYLTETLDTSQQQETTVLSGSWEIGKDVNNDWVVILTSNINNTPTIVAFLDFEQSHRPFTLKLWISEMGGLIFEKK